MDTTPSDIRREVAERILLLRHALSLTPTQMSQRLGVAINTYSQWESGTRSPQYADLMRFKKRLRVSLDYLLAGDDAQLPHDLAEKLNMLQGSIAELLREQAARKRKR